MLAKRPKRTLRHLKIRKRVKGYVDKPRLSVFKSNRYIYAQLIDDNSGKTLASTSDKSSKEKNRIKKAQETGLKLAKLGVAKKIKKVVFDRSGYKYHGRVKALAQGAREGGLNF